MTIIDIQENELDFSVFELISSIVILVISVFVYAMNFKERSLKAQDTYIKMQKILRKFTTLQDTKKLEEDYYILLSNSENHSECDYLKVLYSTRNEIEYKEKNGIFGVLKYMNYYWCLFKNRFIVILLFIAPILVILFKLNMCNIVYECI